MGLDVGDLNAVTLDSIAPREAFEQAVADGWVNRSVHPDQPYEIWNYSKRAQFDRHWDQITRVSRGLITNIETGEIVARPFPKFFNAGEDDAPIPLHEPVVVTEKVDGSLGIVYTLTNGELAVATRGSFASDQAQHATGVLRQRYANFNPPSEWTFLFEILYPENRIVVDYGGLDDLVLLGAVDKSTGRSVPLAEAAEYWTGPVVSVHPFRSFGEVSRDGISENHEGFVVHFQESDLRLKVKSDWYFKMHRLFTQTSARTIWENLVEGLDVESVFEDLPSEFRDWAIGTARALRDSHRAITENVDATFAKTLSDLGDDWTRKDFALAVSQNPLRGYLFARLDGKDISPMIWRAIKPDSEKPFAGEVEADEIA